ncbi:MAG: secretion protein [Thermoproteus sp.]
MEELVELAAILAAASLAVLTTYTALLHSTSWDLCEAARLALSHNGSAIVVSALGEISCNGSGCYLGCGLFVPSQRIYYVGGRPALGGVPGVVVVGTTPDGRLYVLPKR